MIELGEGVLRIFGVVHAVGAIVLLYQLRRWRPLEEGIAQLERMAQDAGAGPRAPIDLGRTVWMASGGVLLFIAGVTMALGLRVSVIALGLLSAHQLLYFARQRKRELAATTPEDAEEARPTQATRNGFYGSLALLVTAALLERAGALD